MSGHIKKKDVQLCFEAQNVSEKYKFLIVFVDHIKYHVVTIWGERGPGNTKNVW